MLLQRGNSRGARGQSSDRSRGRGGRGRGVPTSSEQVKDTFEAERLANAAKREQRTNPSTARGRGGGLGVGNHNGGQLKSSGTASRGGRSSKEGSPSISNPFAASVSASPSFATPSAPAANPFAQQQKFGTQTNPFTTTSSTVAKGNSFGGTSQSANTSPFATSSFQTIGSGVFGASSQLAPSSIFGAPSQSKPSAVFRASSQPASNNPFGTPSLAAPNPFSAPSSNNSISSNGQSATPSPFSIAASQQTNGQSTTSSSFQKINSSTITTAPNLEGSSSNPFGKPQINQSGTFNTFGAPASGLSSEQPLNPFAASKLPAARNGAAISTARGSSAFSSSTPSSSRAASENILDSGQLPNSRNRISQPQTTGNSDKNPWGAKLDAHLAKEKIFRPKIPVDDPGDPNARALIEKFFQGPLKTYRAKARKSLMQAGLIDDPEKPKKLSEAIAFKGTCETMCPFKEMFERIIEGPTAVANLEKRRAPDGSLWPALDAMVKKHSRSAAGDEAPLPEDVRSPRALRMTLDYLLYNLLDEADELRKVHGFLWDRTRAIRRDFIFQSSFNPTEHADYVYCLELIARFHVVALHQMSRADLAASDFSEQQEREQLAKTLLSLMHEYDDCRAQGVECKNEPEFRAYYALFHAETPNVMESIQDWEARFWEQSQEIAIATSLVEALQNVWDIKGPQKPYATTDIAFNAFNTFFTIVEDKETSYTMACFAELHFNKIRKAALKTILSAYRKQRDQTKEWTLSKLNEWLRFDDEMDIVSFGEAYGLRFDEGDDGELYLSFEGQDSPSDPFPVYKQQHSIQMVEKKRGHLRLVELIAKATYDEGGENATKEAVSISDERVFKGRQAEQENVEKAVIRGANNDDNYDGLFVTDNAILSATQQMPTNQTPTEVQQPIFAKEQSAKPSALLDQTSSPASSQPVSIFDRVETVKNFGNDFFSRSTTPLPDTATSAMPPILTPIPSSPTVSTSAMGGSKPPTFSFLQPNSQQKVGIDSQAPSPFRGLSSSNTSAATPLSGLFDGNKKLKPSPMESAGHVSSSNPQTAIKPSSSQLPVTNAIPTFMPSSVITSSSQPQEPSQSTFSTSKPTSIGIPAAVSPITQQAVRSTTPPASAGLERTRRFDNFATWYTLGEEGILDQFQEFMLEGILRSAMEIYTKEESDRKAMEAEAQARREADEYRLQFLFRKYAGRWRGIVRRIRVRKHREDTQRIREEMAAAAKLRKEALSESLVDDFRASTRLSRDRKQHEREHSLDSLLDVSSETNSTTTRSIDVHRQRSGIAVKPSARHARVLRSVDLGRSQSSLKASRGDDPLRRSLADHPSYISGESRMHLLKNYHEDRRQTSGVQSDYFRLKARGIHTMPDGTPLASSLATKHLASKRSLDDIPRSEFRNGASEHSKSRSVSASRFPSHSSNQRHVESNMGLEALKAKARDVMEMEQERIEQSNTAKKRRSVDLEEEELFERAKRLKASMDEGTAWYREQLKKDLGE